MKISFPLFKVNGTVALTPPHSPRNGAWIFLYPPLIPFSPAPSRRTMGNRAPLPGREKPPAWGGIERGAGEERCSFRPPGPAPAPDTSRTFPGRRSCGGNSGIRSHLLPPAREPNPGGRLRSRQLINTQAHYVVVMATVKLGYKNWCGLHDTEFVARKGDCGTCIFHLLFCLLQSTSPLLMQEREGTGRVLRQASTGSDSSRLLHYARPFPGGSRL